MQGDGQNGLGQLLSKGSISSLKLNPLLVIWFLYTPTLPTKPLHELNDSWEKVTGDVFWEVRSTPAAWIKNHKKARGVTEAESLSYTKRSSSSLKL